MSELKDEKCPAYFENGYLSFRFINCVLPANHEGPHQDVFGKEDRSWNKRQPAKDCTEYTDCHCGHCEYERQVELSRKEGK